MFSEQGNKTTEVILDKISQLLTAMKCFDHSKKLRLVAIYLKRIKRNTK